jgi:hypothetical protein
MEITEIEDFRIRVGESGHGLSLDEKDRAAKWKGGMKESSSFSIL